MSEAASPSSRKAHWISIVVEYRPVLASWNARSTMPTPGNMTKASDYNLRGERR
jgi:hypothetical protein